ncbi:autoinducer 2 ABC transporter substrate-binding protein [Cryobacterium glaciale]|uniref:Autoinducer 2 ABC transporter substrate-binding protein n=1 Tax=Cryobacterium glaciale TaxID=1259145 RepID=A0A4R8V357_9MICO|nr:autoinducer 2 ABC transporter substrate-binding protein [Cryobacterium glaciale]TFB75873.1 autoinducer 2 ABC transporter substrate-binding protein [Cryobacterium glaciale]
MKHRSFATVFATVAIAAITLTGCTAKNDTATTTGGSADKEITVAFVPKLQGAPYFEAMDTGAKQAAKDLGIKWIMQGPTTADAAAQSDIVRSFIQQKVDAIVVAPNDPNSMAPLLKQAADAGIKVLTADTDAPDSVREVFVNQATADGIGSVIIDSLAGAMGGKGEYAIVSCGETAENLNSWIAAEKAYAPEEYPDLKLVDVVYSGEDQAKGAQMATDLMNAHPNLTGIIGQCSTSAVGVAQAVRDAGKIDKVFTVGLGTPLSMAPYLHDGSSSGSILWDVQNLGYLTAWAGAQLAQGKSFDTTNNVSSDLSAIAYDSAKKMLVLGPAFIFDKDNVDNYNY